MYLIEQITDDPKQKQVLALYDGSLLEVTMSYKPLQFGWFFDSLVWNDFQLNGLRITNIPNMLHQFRNQLPFGIACFSKEDREPYLQQDFSSGASKLYILDADEVQEYADFLNGQT